MNALEHAIRRTANRLGLDIHRQRPAETASGQLAAMLATHAVDVVFDVGANTGQFGRALRDGGYRGRLVSFEPLPDAWLGLSAAARHDPRWEVAPRMALGGEEGSIDVNVSANSVSSSVLGMLDAHAHAAPASTYVDRVNSPLQRLDSVAPSFLHEGCTAFIKVDVQGYETQVLDGAPDLLSRAVGIQLELSLVPLYEGQFLYAPMIDRLAAAGFELWGAWPGFSDPATGRMLQLDAAFFRR